MNLATSSAAIKGRSTTSSSFSDLTDTFAPALPRTEIADPVFRQRCRKIHTLGPRILGELIAELAARTNAPGWVNSRLTEYAAINPGVVEALNCHDWPSDLAALDGGKPS